ncbi:hypothetical protein CEXT_364241 [Caerostris extrusa]|uniref:Uncharacterized protein n=1 Tax=Caerostris extrusa TaxID=172846 RepID=A0AAV4X5R9_CAEEX|nr:hypothetical protein CEXT_364241 [Caerostris extrusa]
MNRLERGGSNRLVRIGLDLGVQLGSKRNGLSLVGADGLTKSGGEIRDAVRCLLCPGLLRQKSAILHIERAGVILSARTNYTKKAIIEASGIHGLSEEHMTLALWKGGEKVKKKKKKEKN